MQHPVWYQSFIDRYQVHRDFVTSLDLNQSETYIHVKFKSTRYIIQNLEYYDSEAGLNKFALFPWFRVMLIPIFYSGLARSLLLTLAPDKDADPVILFQIDEDYDILY